MCIILLTMIQCKHEKTTKARAYIHQGRFPNVLSWVFVFLFFFLWK